MESPVPPAAKKQKPVPYASKQRYDEIVAKLAPTNCRLRVSLEEYLALKPGQTTKMPAVCNKCGVTGGLQLGNLVDKGRLLGCICNGGIRYASEIVYRLIVAKLGTTKYRLRVTLEEYLALNPVKTSRVPTTCIKCTLDGEIGLQHLLHRGDAQKCLCAGVLYATEAGYNRLIAKLETTDHRLRVTLEEYIALKPTSFSKVASTCLKCGIDGGLHLNNFMSHSQLQACFCNGGILYATEASYNRLVSRLEPTHCRLSVTLEEYLALKPSGPLAKVPSICIKCKLNGEVCINSCIAYGQVQQRCNCDNSTEAVAMRFVSAVCETCFSERNLVVECHYRDLSLRGVGGKPLERDAVILECIEGRRVRLLDIEIDGRHHFDSDFHYHPSDNRNRNTFEHDVLKEEDTLNHGVSMARLETDTVARDKANWKAWLQGKIEAAVNRELPNHIYRLSTRDQYVSGEYAERRKGLRIDPTLPAGQPFVATGVLVDVSPPMPVNQQPIIDQMFAARGSPSGA